METRNIYLVFRSDNGATVYWPPVDLAERGTPVDDDGEDMAYVGWVFATPDDNNGE